MYGREPGSYFLTDYFIVGPKRRLREVLEQHLETKPRLPDLR